MAKETNRNSHILLEKAVFQLLLKEPFYAHIFQSFTRIITENIETAAVTIKDGNVAFMLNPVFFSKLNNEEYRVGVLKHEILHVVLLHLLREERKQVNPLLFNIAADLVVNQLIPFRQLPKEAITIDTFKELKLERNKSLEYYINQLKSSVYPYEFILQLFESSFSNHSYWLGEDNNQQILDANLIKATIFRSVEHAKTSGTLPGDLNEMIRLNHEVFKSKLNWKFHLRIFIQKTQVSNLKYSNSRTSKRFGTYPGIKQKHTLHLLIAIDTSGSVNKKELEEFMLEIYDVSRYVADLKIIECDCEIQQSYKYKFTTERVIMGRGGTDFNPVIEYFNENISIFDGMIYFTDGYACQPSIIPRKLCLFVINNTKHNLKTSKNIHIITYNHGSARS